MGGPKVNINIDFKLLQKQKKHLLEISNDKKLGTTKAQRTSVCGIIHLLDAVQDYATDIVSIDKKIVFGNLDI